MQWQAIWAELEQVIEEALETKVPKVVINRELEDGTLHVERAEGKIRISVTRSIP